MEENVLLLILWPLSFFSTWTPWLMGLDSMLYTITTVELTKGGKKTNTWPSLEHCSVALLMSPIGLYF